MNRAVFIDRDGTLIKEAEYADTLKKIQIYKKGFQAVKMLKNAGFKIIVITNQSGVARGFFPESFVKKAHRYLTEQFKASGTSLDAVYYCPHHKNAVITKYRKDCECRKPKPGMVLKAAKRFKLDLKKSFSIGDKLTDIKLGKTIGMKTVLVLTGYGTEERKKLKKSIMPDYIAKNILEAARYILSQNN